MKKALLALRKIIRVKDSQPKVYKPWRADLQALFLLLLAFVILWFVVS